MSLKTLLDLLYLRLENLYSHLEVRVCYKILSPLTGKLYRPWEKRHAALRARLEKTIRKLEKEVSHE